MKKLLIISWCIIALGLILKIFHLPANSLLMVLGCLMLLIHSILYFIKNFKTNLPTVFVLFTFLFWTIYLLFRIQYWHFTGPLLIISLLITLACLIIHVYKKTPLKYLQLILIIYFIFSFIISFTPTHKIYYFFHLNETLNSDYRNESYKAWDKYSWFLYKEGEAQKAIDANNTAQNIVTDYLKTHNDTEAIEFSLIIHKHGMDIKSNNWNDLDH